MTQEEKPTAHTSLDYGKRTVICYQDSVVGYNEASSEP